MGINKEIASGQLGKAAYSLIDLANHKMCTEFMKAHTKAYLIEYGTYLALF